MPKSSPDLLHQRLLAGLDRLIKERYGSFKGAEDATGVRRITLRQWRRGSRRPSLHTLLTTFDRLGFTLLEVVREADLYPELRQEPSRRLAALLPRRQARDPVLEEALTGLWAARKETPVRGPLPEEVERLEGFLDRDPRVARVELQDYLQRARTLEERVTGLALWAVWLNSRGAGVDAGLAVCAALERTSPLCPLYSLLLSVAASVAKNFRAYDLAKDLAERSVLGFLREGDHRNGARGLLTLGIVWWALGDHEASEQAYRDALRLSPDSRFAPMCRFNLIHGYLSRGRVEQALEAVEEHGHSLAEIPPAYAIKMRWLSAKVLVASGRRDAAVDELVRAVRSSRALDENPQVVFQIFFELAELLAEAGRTRELAPLGTGLLPLLARCDDSEDSVAIAGAFLRTLRSGMITEEGVRGFAERFEAARERADSAQ